MNLWVYQLERYLVELLESPLGHLKVKLLVNLKAH